MECNLVLCVARCIMLHCIALRFVCEIMSGREKGESEYMYMLYDGR
jgi:hypothetical protein